MQKKILVTGAAGFIGFHLTRHFQALGDHVIGIDNFNSYYDPSLKHARAAMLAKEDINILTQDIGDYEALKSLIQKEKITHLVHMAAQAGVRYSTEKPHEYLKANVDGFLNILELCRAFPDLSLVYASSSSVYGLNTDKPFRIEDRTDHQASLYGVTKKCNELMAFTYHHLYGVRSTGLRFFTVYGPWGRPDMAYFRFTKAMLEGAEVPLYNGGKMERDFTYIDDIVDGTAAAINRVEDCALFNLGNHHPEKLMKLVEILEKCLGVKAKTRLLPMQLGDVTSTYADISSSRDILGFEPRVSLEEGTERFAKWYRDYHSGLFK